MSQETNANTATLPLQDTTPVDAAELVNTYADMLISNLFEDVDQLFDGDEAALERLTRELESDSHGAEILMAAASASDEPAELAATGDTSETSQIATATTDIDLYQDSGEAGSAEAATTDNQKTRLGRIFDRFLLATTACSLLGVVAVAWMSSQREGNWTFWSQYSAGQAEGLSDSNAEFLNYLNRSLEVVAQQTEAGEVIASADGTQVPEVSVTPVNPSVLPPLANNSGIAGGLSRPQMNVIERVYIPYQTAQPQPAQAQPSAVAPAPQTPTAPAAPVPTSPAPAQPPAPAAVHVLVGVLELGERSAALFEIDGVPQRVYIGERIGSSGWSLVSVSNEEAVVRRNGDVRSIFIGQKF
jgi:hypothetical protein